MRIAEKGMCFKSWVDVGFGPITCSLYVDLHLFRDLTGPTDYLFQDAEAIMVVVDTDRPENEMGKLREDLHFLNDMIKVCKNYKSIPKLLCYIKAGSYGILYGAVKDSREFGKESQLIMNHPTLPWKYSSCPYDF